MRTRTLHTCHFCSNTYSRKEHFERHVRTHTRERPFKCAQCQSTFARSDTWRRHMRACHPTPDSAPPTLDAINSPDLQSEPPAGASANDPVVDPFDSGLDVSATTSTTPTTLLSSGLAPSFGAFDWEWDSTLDLDASFSMEDLGTYDFLNANPSLPWLPLRPSQNFRNDNGTSKSLKPSHRMSEEWFSSLRHSQSSARPQSQTAVYQTATPTTTATADGEISRDALESSLQTRVPDTALPSTHLLNRWLHIFITRLWHLVPIIHLPTFRPAQANPLLLLSICSMGALADGSKDALYHAERLFDGVQKAILVSSSSYITVSEHTLAILQAAAIGQTFALLSGSPSHLMTAQCYHGTLSVAVQRLHDAVLGHSSTANSPIDAFTVHTTPSEQKWRQWIQHQSLVRLLNTIYVHNGEITGIVHTPSPVRTRPLSINTAAPDSIFLTRTASDWESLNSRYTSTHPAAYASFSNCAIVACFIAEMGHHKVAPFDDKGSQGAQTLQRSLSQWFETSVDTLATEEAKKLSLLLLCHSAFMSLLCEIDTMEKACGRDGPNAAEHELQPLRDWASTPNARAAITHAILMFKLLERARVSEVPAIHVARTSWQAGLVLAVYAFFAQPNDNTSTLQNLDLCCPALATVRKVDIYTESDWATLDRDTSPERCKAMAFSLATLLRNLGPWQNAARYAETLDRVLHLLETGTSN